MSVQQQQQSQINPCMAAQGQFKPLFAPANHAKEVQAAKDAGDTAFKSRCYSDADEAYSRAIALSEEHQYADMLHVLYSNRSAARLSLKDLKGALADAQAAVAVDDRWVKGWYRSARALQGLGKLELAVSAAAKAQELEPSNRDVSKLLQDLKHALQQQQPQPIGSAATNSTLQAAEGQPLPLLHQQQQQQAGLPSQLSWGAVNSMRSQLDLTQLPPELVVGSRYLPSPDGVNQNLLLLFHGLGDKPAAFTALAQRMALPQTACLALSGPLTVPETGGGRAWFEAFEDDGELIQPQAGERRRQASLAATVALLQRLVFDVLPSLGGWRPSELHLMGFSQGGTTVLELLRACCRAGRVLGSAVAISAGLLEETLDQQQQQQQQELMSSSADGRTDSIKAASVATPVLITYGDRDDVVPRSTVDRSVDALRAAGCSVELAVLGGKGHGMISSQEEMHRCMQFWAQHLKRRPADPGFEEVSTRA